MNLFSWALILLLFLPVVALFVYVRTAVEGKADASQEVDGMPVIPASHALHEHPLAEHKSRWPNLAPLLEDAVISNKGRHISIYLDDIVIMRATKRIFSETSPNKINKNYLTPDPNAKKSHFYGENVEQKIYRSKFHDVA